MKVFDLPQLLVKLIEWVARGYGLNLLCPQPFRIFVDVQKPVRLILDTRKKAGNLMITVQFFSNLYMPR